MELKEPTSSGSAGREFYDIVAAAAARVPNDDTPAAIDSVHRPAIAAGYYRQSFHDDEPMQVRSSYALMSTVSSRGPMTRSQSSHDEGYGCHQDFAATSVPFIDRPSISRTPALNVNDELNDEEFDDNDDDGFAWEGSVSDRKARSGSIDNSKIGRYGDYSQLSPTGCASIVSANSRNGTSPSPRNVSMPALPYCSMPSTPDSKLSAGLEEAETRLLSLEAVHNVSFSGRSSHHQHRAGAMSVSLHSAASRTSGSMAERLDVPIDQLIPLPTNLHYYQPPHLISPDLDATTSSHVSSQTGTATRKLDLLEEQEKELVELAIERSKQDAAPVDHFEPSLRKALAESMKTPTARHSNCHSASLSFSFALSEPPPPAPSLNGMISISQTSPPNTSSHVPRTRTTQPDRLIRTSFLSESLPPLPTPFPSEREISTTKSSVPGTISASSSHNSNVMGPEDFSTSEVEEQRMLRMALERSLHEPSSPRRPHSRASPSPRHTSSCFAGDTK